MRASRLLSILILLQMRGRMSAAALADEFEVSVRTVHRDIDHLSAAGVPVYAERGRSGGFALLDGYETRLLGLTAGEAEVLLLAGLGAAANDLGVGPELAAAQLKLAASLPAAAGSRAQAISQRFHFDPVDWYRRAEAVPILPMIAGAVWRGRRLRIAYQSWTGSVERLLDPLGLVLKAGAWYLIAAVDRKPRTYRVSNIKAAALLDEESWRPARFNLPRYWRAHLEEFEKSLLKEKARVRLSPRGEQLLRQISEAAADAIDRGRAPGGEEWIEAEIPIESIDHAAGQLLRLGAEIEIIAPAALRRRLATEARRMTGLYRRKSGKRRANPQRDQTPDR